MGRLLAEPSPLTSFEGAAADDTFGCNVASAGDFNADGYDDLIVNACGHDGTSGDNIPINYVYSGADDSQLFYFEGETTNSEYIYNPHELAGIGDFNGDGYDDIVIGDTRFKTASGDRIGKIYVFSGADQSLLYTLKGERPGTGFGEVFPAGDVNGDGKDDFYVGAARYGDDLISDGRIYVIEGR